MQNPSSHINYGFRHEEDRPPPYAPPTNPAPLYPTLPHYTTAHNVPINTQRTSTPGQPHLKATPKTVRKSKCPCIIAVVVVIILLAVAVIAALTWYFTAVCIGKRCGDSSTCVSSSDWCNGKVDCPGGEDEAQCFRLYGPNFILQSYSNNDQNWKPVCTSRWDNSISRETCRQIGYDNTDYVNYDETNSGFSDKDGFMILNSQVTSGMVHGSLESSKSCPTRKAVTLKCIACGTRSRSGTRIVGGEVVTTTGRWPWQVSLQAGNRHLCGGSIISSRWIVTAAHCVENTPYPFQWKVYAGYLKLREMSVNNGYTVQNIISHPNYNSKNNDNDIALMKLQSPLRMSSTVGAVCLPNSGLDVNPPSNAYITGWGALFTQGPASNDLREARVSLIDRSICNNRQVYNGQITDSMICAGKLEGGVDSCQGDSGGPLVTEKNSIWWLVGDTSWGEGCAQRNKPGVYGNMTYFLEWIYGQMQKY